MTTTNDHKRSVWRWVRHNGERLYDFGILDDGAMRNPNGYPEEIVRAAIEGVKERLHLPRGEAAKQAARTHRRRREGKVYELVERLKNYGQLPPALQCCICGKGLDDSESLERGVGSHCWQDVLRALEAAQ